MRTLLSQGNRLASADILVRADLAQLVEQLICNQ